MDVMAIETNTAAAARPAPAVGGPAATAVGTASVAETKRDHMIAEDAPPIPAPAQRPPQQQALRPAQPPFPIGQPVLAPGELKRLALTNRRGGRMTRYDVLTCPESDLVCLFVRSLKKAIYGEVWDALVVELIEVCGQPRRFKVLKDETGRDRRLAVKRMPWDKINYYRRHLKEDPLQEIAALSMMSDPGHPHVLRKVEALDDGQTVYLLTPFVDGGELFDWIADNRGAPESVVRPMFRQIVDGMRYMHQRGICHADMSLENCLVDSDRTKAFIIDFGMCLAMPRNEEGRRYMSMPDQRKAKPSYCCPETFKGKEYDGVKVDVFAAGAMLFMMLTGFPPFEQATRLDPNFRQLVWNRDVQGLLRRLGARPVDQRAADLLRRMLAYKAGDRLLPEQVLVHEWMTGAPAGG